MKCSAHLVAYFALALSPLALFMQGCCSDQIPEDLRQQNEQEGVDFIGALGGFKVHVRSIHCQDTDDGFFGGYEDEITVRLYCRSGGSKQYKGEFTAGSVVENTCYGGSVGTAYESVISGSLEVHCQPGESVTVSIWDVDDFSSNDVGGYTLEWSAIEAAVPGQLFPVRMQLAGTSVWDSLYEWFRDQGGICLTDLLPFAGKAARALKWSKKAVKFIKTAKKLDKKFQKAQEKLSECDGTEACGNVLDTMDAIYDAQCSGGNPGQYNLVLQVTGSARLASCTWLAWAAMLGVLVQ
eukprot:Skav217817  [mRNA]  locus=scaffold889:160361:161245:+ [translate_table: standard]